MIIILKRINLDLWKYYSLFSLRVLAVQIFFIFKQIILHSHVSAIDFFAECVLCVSGDARILIKSNSVRDL